MLHAPGNLSNKSRTACVAECDARCLAVGHRHRLVNDLLDFGQPLFAITIGAQFSTGLHENDPECAVARTEHFLSLAKSWNRTAGAFGQTRQSEWIVTQPCDFFW